MGETGLLFTGLVPLRMVESLLIQEPSQEVSQRLSPLELERFSTAGILLSKSFTRVILLIFLAHLIMLIVLPSPGLQSVEIQSHSDLMLTLISRSLNATESQNFQMFKKPKLKRPRVHGPPPCNQVSACTSTPLPPTTSQPHWLSPVKMKTRSTIQASRTSQLLHATSRSGLRTIRTNSSSSTVSQVSSRMLLTLSNSASKVMSSPSATSPPPMVPVPPSPSTTPSGDTTVSLKPLSTSATGVTPSHTCTTPPNGPRSSWTRTFTKINTQLTTSTPSSELSTATRTIEHQQM